MSVVYNQSPNIAGLICSIDAANKKSYPGQGTVVYDLSGNGKNGTLSTGVTWSSQNGGRFDLDGNSGNIMLGTGNTFFPTSEFALELWFRSTGTTAPNGTQPGLFGGTYGMRMFCQQNSLSNQVNINATSGSTSLTGFSTPAIFDFYNGQWNHVVWQVRGTEAQCFINGTLQSTQALAYWTGETYWPTNGFNIGRDNNDQMYFFTGSISVIRIYKTYLTELEVAKNFNSLRGRYGV